MPFPKRRYIPETTIKAQKKTFDQTNLEAARIYLASGQYGPETLIGQWARAILPDFANDRPELDGLPLFRRSA